MRLSVGASLQTGEHVHLLHERCLLANLHIVDWTAEGTPLAAAKKQGSLACLASFAASLHVTTHPFEDSEHLEALSMCAVCAGARYVDASEVRASKLDTEKHEQTHRPGWYLHDLSCQKLTAALHARSESAEQMCK